MLICFAVPVCPESVEPTYLPGSPVVAFDAAQDSGVPFNRLFISDSDANNVDAARGRLEDKGAIVTAVANAAEVAIDDVARQLNPHGLHFALLDRSTYSTCHSSSLRSCSRLSST